MTEVKLRPNIMTLLIVRLQVENITLKFINVASYDLKM